MKERTGKVYERRLKAIKRRLKKWEEVELEGDDAPEKCLDILERIVEKGRPVIRNFVWDTVDKYFHSLVKNMWFSDEEKYDRLMRRYDIINDKADEVNESLLLGVRGNLDDFDGIGIKTAYKIDTYSLELARGRRD